MSLIWKYFYDEENNLVIPTTENMQDTLVISKQNNKTVAIEVDISDDEYGDSSSDSSWRQNLHSDNEDELVLDRVSNDDSEDSDTNFSDFEDNEAEIMVPDSESEEGDDPMRQLMGSKMWIYNPKDDIEFEKGQLFINVDAFRAVLKDYVIQKGFPLLRLKNERSRVTAICNAEGCQWRIHASPVADNITFQIKSYQPQHTCVMDKHCVEATSNWMAKKLVGVMRDHPNMTSKGVETKLKKYGMKPSKMQIFRSKNKVLNEIEGTHTESYSKLPKYAELLRNNNPNSICKIHYDRPNLLVEPKFLRIFISFRAQKLRFLEGCSSFVGFDGCFLKGPFGGVLLIAVALDANNSIFPIAFAVIEYENKDTWWWFFYYFQEFFGPFDNNIPLTFMTDRQKGWNLTYKEIFPDATKRHYCRHICSNFKSQFSRILLRSFFWKAAKSYDVVGYNEAMVSIKDINITVWRCLDKIPRSSWCRHVFSSQLKCDHVTNNFTESFNDWVGDLRGKPILTLVDGLRRMFIKKLHKRYQKGCTLTANITPRIAEKLTEISQASRKYEMHMASENTFEIGDLDRSYIVNLSKRICDCGTFQISGIPCKYAALGEKNWNITVKLSSQRTCI
ncbi:uncharacterized protein [Coffea arabica]|uniref:SWIM-type domain-containing protein n=1 Tax=Coffea arabica TaxID=13443 RepID=A0ABM4VHC9_COFAR